MAKAYVIKRIKDKRFLDANERFGPLSTANLFATKPEVKDILEAGEVIVKVKINEVKPG